MTDAAVDLGGEDVPVLTTGEQAYERIKHDIVFGVLQPGQRLPLDRLCIGARIVALVNRYDNLCNPASLAHAHTPHEALSLLFAQSRAQFDASLLNAFIRMMGVYPAGSVVQLTDERYALVVSVNSTRPLKPKVLVHDAQRPREEALHLNLMDTPDLGIRRSLKLVDELDRFEQE